MRSLAVALILSISWSSSSALDQDALSQLLLDRRCDACDLRSADLVHADLAGARLRQAQLQRANLSQATLDVSDMIKPARLKGQVNESHAQAREGPVVMNFNDVGASVCDQRSQP